MFLGSRTRPVCRDDNLTAISVNIVGSLISHNPIRLYGDSFALLCFAFFAFNHWIGGWVGHRVGLDPAEKKIIFHCKETGAVQPLASHCTD
jgi:hypothetical protein